MSTDFTVYKFQKGLTIDESLWNRGNKDSYSIVFNVRNGFDFHDFVHKLFGDKTKERLSDDEDVIQCFLEDFTKNEEVKKIIFNNINRYKTITQEDYNRLLSELKESSKTNSECYLACCVL